MPDLYQKPSWLDAIKIYRNPKAINLFFLGFSSGLPLMLVFSTLSFWLREAGVSRSEIGYFSWVGLAYSIKWIWSPLVDKLNLPWLNRCLGRRRAWLLVSQSVVVVGLLGMAFTDPSQNLAQMALFAVLVAFSSATQDIVIDAFRIEVAESRLQAALAAMYVFGYRAAMLLAGAGSLVIAAQVAEGSQVYQQYSWTISYLSMCLFMCVGVITTFLSQEPFISVSNRSKIDENSPQLKKISLWFYTAVACPFIDFFKRYGWNAVILLALIGVYRISDIVLGIMANPFYVDLGFTKQEVAAISKFYGVLMTLVGVALGGSLTMKYGVMRIMLLGAIASSATNILFSMLSLVGHDVFWLTSVISLDNLSGGIATAAFIAWMSKLVNVEFSASQYALLSSIMLFLPKFVAGFSGVVVDAIGYHAFFIGTAILGIPVVILIMLSKKVFLLDEERKNSVN